LTPHDPQPILIATLRESTMLMLIIGMSLLYSYDELPAHQPIDGTMDRVAATSRWVLLTAILLMVVVLGFFLPPVSIILMTAPIILPPLKAAGLIWSVRRGHDHRHGNGIDSSTRGLEHLRHQEHRAGHSLRDVVWGVMPFVC
jgi:hypothetical protein